ncbi:threonine synthase [Rickettsiales bacterium]|nr:threonine synthase [Rickettsiales bacterium]
MKYISTRGKAPKLSFEDVVLQGLAEDGGLYIPETLPKFSEEEIKKMKKLNYQDLTFKIVQPFIAGEISDEDLKKIIEKSYSKFSNKAIAPIKQLSNDQFLLELFHGPTLAFKDFALQFLGNIFDFILERRKEKVVIIGATSGDTGSAAIMGCRDSQNVDIFILHPYQRVSDVQRKQMTTVIHDNVHNVSLKGNFDDCQEYVKEMFSDQSFLNGRRMAAVNSINWVRIMAQIVYYFYSALRVDICKENPISFCVPTGNFGDIYAGYLAKRMGLPINKLIVATNQNDILTRFFQNNDYSRQDLIETLSPSMNIQVSSNFERMLFDYHRKFGKESEIFDKMADFKKSGKLTVSKEILDDIRKDFDSYSISDEETCQIINRAYHDNEEILDPHTATGIGATDLYQKSKDYQGEYVVILATAHPAKFPDAVQKSGAPEPKLPLFLSDLMEKKEEMTIIDKNLNKVKEFISNKI